MIQYALFPGEGVLKPGQEPQYIGVRLLAWLHGVDPMECMVIREQAGTSRYVALKGIIKKRGLKELHPNMEGVY